jgi:hypothetical protein
VEEILGERGQMFQTALTYHERHLESELTLVLKGETGKMKREATRALIKGDTGSGLIWTEISLSNQVTKTGTEIQNPALAQALQQKVEFRLDEVEKFKLGKISHGHYIKVRVEGGGGVNGHIYFAPGEAIDDVAVDIKNKFKDETAVHKGRSAEWFNDDNNYRAAIDEVLDLKAAALQTFEYYVTTKSTSARVMKMDLRKAANAYRKHLEQLMNEESGAARKDLARKLLECQGFALAPDGSSLKHLCQCAAEGNRWHIERMIRATKTPLPCLFSWEFGGRNALWRTLEREWMWLRN